MEDDKTIVLDYSKACMLHDESHVLYEYFFREKRIFLMARIPDEEIERLKREVSIEHLAKARGVELKPHGGNLIGLCPFHEDHEPSLVITSSKNLWHCLGACRAGGSVIDWVMKAEGVSFRHAVEILRRDPSSLAAFPGSAKHSTVRKLAPVLAMDAEDREILRQVVDYYHATLKESPEALRYLEKRGLRSPEMIERFKLGFANRTLGYRLPPKRCKAGEEMRGRLQRLGIYRASGHEHFTGSLVIPVMDEAGSVAEVYGRKIRDDLPDKSPTHLYLPGPHKGVWNIEALVASKEIILCEALIDALTFWSAGYRNVTSSYGIQGVSEDHLQAFKRYGTERVLIAYDRDDAGERAAETLAGSLMKEGIACYRIRFPRGMDANECALKMAPAERILGVLIRGASYLGSGKPPARDAAARPGSDCGTETIEPAAGEKNRDGGKSEEERDGTLPLVASGGRPLNDPVRRAAKEKKEADEPGTLTASPHTPKIPEPIPAEIKEDEVVIALCERRWRVRGLSRNLTFGQLRVNVLVSAWEGYHVETLDLYSARQRSGFIKEASQETKVAEEVIKKDLGKVLLKLEEIQEETIRSALEPKEKPVIMSDQEREEALSFLKAPGLLDRILRDFERCGVVGEETNKLVGYLACVSRKLEDPLAVIIQSSSAAGKSSLMESILAFTPQEDRVKYSAMTGQSLFYMQERDLASKVLALVEEEGAQRASYALKLLQSEGSSPRSTR
jgi:DNA primase catalytic core